MAALPGVGGGVRQAGAVPAGSRGIKMPGAGLGRNNMAPPVAHGGARVGNAAPTAPRSPAGRAAAARANTAQQPTSFLAPMTPKQVQDTAVSYTKSAYAPALHELGSLQKTENGILTKQTADDKFYQQWVASKGQMLLANQEKVDSATNALESQLTGQTLNPQTEVAGMPQGAVSNETPFLSSTVGAQAAGLAGVENAAAGQTAATESNSSNLVGAAIANDQNAIQAGQVKEDETWQTGMSKIATEVSSVLGKEGSTLGSEIMKLNQQQIQLGENTRNYDAAMVKLGMMKANDTSLAASRAASANAKLVTERQGWARLSETQARDAANAAYHDKEFALNQEKFGQIVAKDMYERTHHLGPYKLTGANAPLTHTSQNVIYNHIDTIRTKLTAVIAAFEGTGVKKNSAGVVTYRGMGLNPTEARNRAYHAVLTGSYVDAAGKRVNIPRVDIETNPQLLNAAFNTLPGGSGLSPGDIKALEAMGLTNPQQVLG